MGWQVRRQRQARLPTHALCNAHAVRELVYVVDTAPANVAALATQAIDAMIAVKDLGAACREQQSAP